MILKLEETWSALENELRRTLDKIIPEEKQKRKHKPPRHWYTNRLLDQRKIELWNESSLDIENNTNGKPLLGKGIDTSKCLDSTKEAA